MAKLRVSTDGTAGPYIMVPSGQSDALMAYLSERGGRNPGSWRSGRKGKMLRTSSTSAWGPT